MAKGTNRTQARPGSAVGIRLDRRLHQGMRVVAAERGTSVNRLYNAALAAFLADAGAARFVPRGRLA